MTAAMKNFCYSTQVAQVTQRMRQAPHILDSQRIMFRDLTTLLSTFSDGLTRWCGNWRHNLTTPSLDDGTSATSGLAFLVEAVDAMAASHAQLSVDLSQRVVEPLSAFPKANYRKNWFGRLKDAAEFEEEHVAAQAPLLDAVKKMDKAKRRFQDITAKIARVVDNRFFGKGEAKLARMREEAEMARLAYNNCAMAVTICQRQCRQIIGAAYGKVWNGFVGFTSTSFRG